MNSRSRRAVGAARLDAIPGRRCWRWHRLTDLDSTIIRLACRTIGANLLSSGCAHPGACGPSCEEAPGADNGRGRRALPRGGLAALGAMGRRRKPGPERRLTPRPHQDCRLRPYPVGGWGGPRSASGQASAVTARRGYHVKHFRMGSVSCLVSCVVAGSYRAIRYEDR